MEFDFETAWIAAAGFSTMLFTQKTSPRFNHVFITFLLKIADLQVFSSETA